MHITVPLLAATSPATPSATDDAAKPTDPLPHEASPFYLSCHKLTQLITCCFLRPPSFSDTLLVTLLPLPGLTSPFPAYNNLKPGPHLSSLICTVMEHVDLPSDPIILVLNPSLLSPIFYPHQHVYL